MSIFDHCLNFVSDESARLATVQGDDDLEGLAGALAAANLIVERISAQLDGRVSQQAIDEGAAAAKTALGW